jgi:hypothetical protein
VETPAGEVVELGSRTREVLAWALWLVTFGCCAAGLLVTLATVRPLTLRVLAEGAMYAFFFVLGSATVGLVLALRRPGNPIGWLYGAAGLAWAYTVPVSPGSTSSSASAARSRWSPRSSRPPGT